MDGRNFDDLTRRLAAGSTRRSVVRGLAGGLAAIAGVAGFARADAKDQAKVTICHKPGTPAQKTKEVPASAVDGHLGHGDYLGECKECPKECPGKCDKDGKCPKEQCPKECPKTCDENGKCPKEQCPKECPYDCDENGECPKEQCPKECPETCDENGECPTCPKECPETCDENGECPPDGGCQSDEDCPDGGMCLVDGTCFNPDTCRDGMTDVQCCIDAVKRACRNQGGRQGGGVCRRRGKKRCRTNFGSAA